MKKTVKVADLMELVQEARLFMLDSTVGFVKAIRSRSGSDNSPPNAVIAGTGVLVSANGRSAILTADHVLENLPDHGQVGLVLLDRRGRVDHRFILEMNNLEKITVGRGPEEALGPDLALLLLPDVDVHRLEVKKSFYNLTKRKETMLKQPPANEVGPWVTYGFIAEMTEASLHPQGVLKNYTFKVLCGPVTVPSARDDGHFDYFSVEVNSGEPYQAPQSYEGSSGSGMWLLHISEHEGRLILLDVSLGGIVFYQSACEDSRRFIQCHGAKSIYGFVEEALARGRQPD